MFVIALVYYAASNKETERNKLPLAIYLGGLALFVGCADMLGGYDRYIYGEVFDIISVVQHRGDDMALTIGYRLFSTEWGFLWFNQLLGHVTMNRYVFIFITTCIIYTLLFISIKRYCRNYPFAVIVFMGLWFFFTFTYLRQVMAATIGWLAIQYAIDRKPIPYFLIVFIAFTFHNSAIVLVPFYFVPAKKYNPVVVILIMLLCLGVGISNVLGGLFAASEMIANESKALQNVDMIEEGAFRIAYLAEAIVFLMLLLFKYDVFNEKSRRQIVLLNMALLFCAMLLLFIRSENGGRFAWNYMIGIIASITHIATHPSHKNSAITGVLVMMFCVLFIRILTFWGIRLTPYKSFFSNGHREGDYIYEIYEYDRQYDVDKFYK